MEDIDQVGSLPSTFTNPVITVAPAQPQGILSIATVEHVLSPEGNYSAALSNDKAVLGARVVYRFTYKNEIARSGNYVVDMDVIGIKFPSAAQGTAFAETVATILANPAATQDADCGRLCTLNVGVLPAPLQIQGAATTGGSLGYSWFQQLLEADGTYYLVTSHSSFNRQPFFLTQLAEFLDGTYTNCRIPQNHFNCERTTPNHLPRP